MIWPQEGARSWIQVINESVEICHYFPTPAYQARTNIAN